MDIDLDRSLIEFKDTNSKLDWTIRDAVEGLQIFGGIGSGKTSGSGRHVALKFLANDFGGIVLTVKEDEVKMWREYCRTANRSQDLIVIEPGSKNYFNFLEYESSSRSSGRSTENIVQVLKTVIRASEEKAGGKTDDPFWETALDMLMFHLIDLCVIAYGKATVQMLYDIAQSLPKETDKTTTTEKDTHFNRAYFAARNIIMSRIDAWYEAIPKDIRESDEFISNLDQKRMDEVKDLRNFQYIDQFFSITYRNLSEKTRSIIDFSFTGFMFRLMQEPVYSLFCRHESNVVPEDCLQGKIIIVNLPVKIYNKVGRDAQILFKYIWQRAMEKRNVNVNGRPIFLWADEAQNFLHEYDAEYQATARSSRIATVYISQNMPNYLANMGGDKSDYKVKSFLGTLATKIFHANADIETNTYSADLIGEAYQLEESEATSSTDGKVTVTKTISSKLAKIVRPEEFVGLRTGGPLNDYKVSGYIHIQGKRFSNGFNYKKVIFSQKVSL